MTITQDMRQTEPLEYIRAVGLQPEDSYGFLPLDMHDEVVPFFYLYRDRPEYEEPRVKLPGPEYVQRMGPAEIFPSTGSDTQSLEDLKGIPGLGGLEDIVAGAQQMQQQYSGMAPGAPAAEPDTEKIARIEKLREIGAIDDDEFAKLLIEAGGTPGDAPISKPEGAPSDAPPLVMDRIYPGIRSRASNRQLNHHASRYRDTLGLCPEDTYGVFPRSTRTSHSTDSSSTEWDDYWIVYRDRPEYEAGRASWAKSMDSKGRWPDPVITPGVAPPSSAVYGKEKVKVEKDRWPREKMVVRKKGTDLGDVLRKKIAAWGYEPEDSLGFCPDFDNSAIYFAWAKR